MWINVKDNTPASGSTVLVRFNGAWVEEENDYLYMYAVAYYDGMRFVPDGVESNIEGCDELMFNGGAIPVEWKEWE